MIIFQISIKNKFYISLKHYNFRKNLKNNPYSNFNSNFFYIIVFYLSYSIYIIYVNISFFIL